jgi:hypothetical protein
MLRALSTNVSSRRPGQNAFRLGATAWLCLLDLGFADLSTYVSVGYRCSRHITCIENERVVRGAICLHTYFTTRTSTWPSLFSFDFRDFLARYDMACYQPTSSDGKIGSASSRCPVRASYVAWLVWERRSLGDAFSLAAGSATLVDHLARCNIETK